MLIEASKAFLVSQSAMEKYGRKVLIVFDLVRFCLFVSISLIRSVNDIY